MRVSQTGSNPIPGVDTGSAQEAHGARRTEKNEKTGGAKKAERPSAADIASGAQADISPRAKDLSHAKQVASDAPDVREEKIAELRRRIDAGKYNVNADAIADRMVDEHVSMRGIG